ncbi:hypothetical protein GCM10010191_85520 [Actinomadura vinacea]|uniref:DoxX family membrane protein n=1 Tax=Actinomadura vinacea TaxID=115336 RepID=A0ABN3KA81_9ACTN
MRRKIELRRVPPRLAAGALILDQGLLIRGADEQTAARLHGMAANVYPFFGKLPPKKFARLLSGGEIALGAALILPGVPAALAGAGLTAFAAGLVGMYLRTPGMRRPGSLGPTQEGTLLAKDVVLLGMGLGLVIDGTARKRD